LQNTNERKPNAKKGLADKEGNVLNFIDNLFFAAPVMRLKKSLGYFYVPENLEVFGVARV